MTSDGAESPISYGEEESVHSSSVPIDRSNHGAAPDTNVAINSEQVAVYPTVHTSSDSCVSVAADVMTDIYIVAKPGLHPDNSHPPNIDTLEAVTEMVMYRS